MEQIWGSYVHHKHKFIHTKTYYQLYQIRTKGWGRSLVVESLPNMHMILASY